jgi:hypothetical protein
MLLNKLIEVIENNTKLDDIHVMYILQQMRHFHLRKNDIGCDIRIVDSLITSSFLEMKKIHDNSTKKEVWNRKRKIGDILHIKDGESGIKRRKIQAVEQPTTIIIDDDDDNNNNKTTIITREEEEEELGRLKDNEEKKRRRQQQQRHIDELFMYFLKNKREKEEVKDGDIIIILPFYGESHWSLVVYCSFNDTWFHIDSIKHYHRKMVRQFFTKFMTICETSQMKHLILPSRKSVVCEFPGMRSQVGNWECGYYMVIFSIIFMNKPDIELLRVENRDFPSLTEKLCRICSKPEHRIIIMQKIVDIMKKYYNPTPPPTTTTITTTKTTTVTFENNI